jgi:HNH endonuclease
VIRRAPQRRQRMARRARIRAMSPRRRAVAADYTAFVLGIKDRDGWRCMYCRTRSGPLDPHHVVKRSQGGVLMDPDNVVTLCRTCHDWTDAAYASSEGRLVVDTLGSGRFVFSIVRAASKWSARVAGDNARFR